MSHARQQIREAIGTLLNTITGLTVFESRQTEKYADDDLPAATVLTLEDRVLPDTQPINSLDADRALTISIEVRAKHTTGIDDELDDLATSIEETLGADLTLSGLVRLILLDSTEIEIDDGSLERPVGLMKMTYSAIYRVSSDDVETIL